MSQDDFNKYLKERYQDQIEWYDMKASINQKKYRLL